MNSRQHHETYQTLLDAVANLRRHFNADGWPVNYETKEGEPDADQLRADLAKLDAVVAQGNPRLCDCCNKPLDDGRDTFFESIFDESGADKGEWLCKSNCRDRVILNMERYDMSYGGAIAAVQTEDEEFEELGEGEENEDDDGTEDDPTH
jgi:hypothetical protein